MLFIIILIFSPRQVTAYANVALNKTVTYCSTKFLSNLMVDGVKDINQAEKIFDSCAPKSFVSVHLRGHFYVHYVVVYEGRSIGTFGQGGLDYFLVEYIDSTGHKHPCSMYPKGSTGPRYDIGMRVNCIVNKLNIINLVSRRSRGFAIAELEVYTLASGISGENVMIYYGCYSSFATLLKLNFRDFKNCLKNCGERFYIFAAIKIDECHCGLLELGLSSLPITECNFRCEENYCGSNDSYSVYIVNLQLPFNHGCRSTSDFTGAVVSGNMTISKCLLICIDHMYAGLLNGDNCVCSDMDLNTYFIDYESCDVPCSGDPDKICGGINHYSLYATKAQRSAVTVLNLTRCTGLLDEYGDCSDFCAPGYIGDYCLEVSAINCELYDPCEDKANTICIVVDNYYICRCLPGYSRNKKGDCIEIHIDPYQSAYLFYNYMILIAFVLILFFTIIAWINSLFRQSSRGSSQQSELGISGGADSSRSPPSSSTTRAIRIASAERLRMERDKSEKSDADKMDTAISMSLPMQRSKVTMKEIKAKRPFPTPRRTD